MVPNHQPAISLSHDFLSKELGSFGDGDDTVQQHTIESSGTMVSKSLWSVQIHHKPNITEPDVKPICKWLV